MDPLPDPRLLPIPQAAPAGATASVVQFSRQILPSDAGPEDEEDAGQNRTIVAPLPTALRLIRAGRQEGLDDRPQVVWEDLLRHPTELAAFAEINRGS